MVIIEEAINLPNLNLNKSGLLVVAGIPAYNEEKAIARVVMEAQKFSDIVIVCDDGSADLTGEIAERLGAVVIRHERNKGYGAALQSLFKKAKMLNADVLVTFDSDGQHDPAQIPLLVEPIKKGMAEVVLGSRFTDKAGCAEMPRYRKIGIKVITTLSNGTGKNSVSDAQSGFRAYSRLALDQLGSFSNKGMSASIEILHKINKTQLRMCEVPISCKYGSLENETSSEHPWSHGISLIMNLVRLVVEDRPITYLGVPGVFSLIIGVFFGIWMFNLYAIEQRIITNIALAAIAFLLIGFFMLSTAITLYALTRINNKISA